MIRTLTESPVHCIYCKVSCFDCPAYVYVYVYVIVPSQVLVGKTCKIQCMHVGIPTCMLLYAPCLAFHTLFRLSVLIVFGRIHRNSYTVLVLEYYYSISDYWLIIIWTSRVEYVFAKA